ncbi:MAG TPA: T9SS type A sorting domain-containing protein, partial [Cytophagaceae bacterium]|nr:T9SS type A sorting domain-containing protein [Cytophagaceae bacterium]
IPLHLIAALDGAYSFTADLSAFSSTASVILEDRLLGITQDLSLNPTYTATLSKGDYQGRFFIHYNQKQSAVTGNASPTAGAGDIEISAYQQNVFILFPNQNDGNANITVFDAVGKKVYSMENTSINTGRIDFNLPTADGIYIVNVQTAAANKAQQIFVQK